MHFVVYLIIMLALLIGATQFFDMIVPHIVSIRNSALISDFYRAYDLLYKDLLPASHVYTVPYDNVVMLVIPQHNHAIGWLHTENTIKRIQGNYDREKTIWHDAITSIVAKHVSFFKPMIAQEEKGEFITVHAILTIKTATYSWTCTRSLQWPH